MTQPVALVAGANGIIGNAVAHELRSHGWKVRALGRKPVNGFETLTVDLTVPVATAAALEAAGDTTHLFYASLSPDSNLAIEATRNAGMLSNLLDGLEAARAPLQRVVIYQGYKIYGVHLGAQAPIPARESDPPHMPPNLYMAQEATLRERAKRSAWNYVALRPDVVVGDVTGNPMNIALVVGVFATISQKLGIPLRFPGTEKAYRQLVQFTDSALLARASYWAATSNHAVGEAFNVTNGDVFRWERMWEDVAMFLGMPLASPVPLVLARHMADKGPIWREIAEEHGLAIHELDQLVNWEFGDFVFHTETDVISDVNKIYRFGFTERMDSTSSLLTALDRFRGKNILPLLTK
ncbi:SDR family oxidoreductase [Gluconacetobacter aggeris]|uniref:SDR family oxidoreductase n=1 Tax=Gluconacetobacter aggeris TaxID=1286186 RepID=A0A7W4ISF0_9PROT|nr:SDR family oxidoreductase [Gluconacetobacter aggeris]MBB2168127.1 SDR family oxidoreductase [Gluconacetobacter aggeris]